jgi:hypothetical protein
MNKKPKDMSNVVQIKDRYVLKTRRTTAFKWVTVTPLGLDPGNDVALQVDLVQQTLLMGFHLLFWPHRYTGSNGGAPINLVFRIDHLFPQIIAVFH